MLDRDELAARCLVAGLHDPSRSAPAAERAEFAVECADALLAALVPVAPASGATATEPRRTVGAVVRDGSLRHYDEDDLLIVVADDPAACQRFLDNPRRDLSLADAYPEDEFVRWATREECERHGLNYVARPLPGAPLAAPPRPEWVRITSLNAGGTGFLTVGKVYRVTGFGHRGCPQVNNDQGDGMWCLSSRGLSPDPESPTFASWEPCAAPSPAATPAAWVPSVGDVVKHVSESDAVATTGQIRVVVSTNPIRWVYVENGVRKGESGPTGWGNDVRFVRRATSSERAAAGLPVDVEESRSGDDRPASGQSATKPVDRVALAKVLREAGNGELWCNSKPWGELGVDAKGVYLKMADAAIAHLKASGGAS